MRNIRLNSESGRHGYLPFSVVSLLSASVWLAIPESLMLDEGSLMPMGHRHTAGDAAREKCLYSTSNILKVVHHHFVIACRNANIRSLFGASLATIIVGL